MSEHPTTMSEHPISSMGYIDRPKLFGANRRDPDSVVRLARWLKIDLCGCPGCRPKLIEAIRKACQ